MNVDTRFQNFDPKRFDKRLWSIAKVEDNNDTAKRQRLRLRFAHEKDLKKDNLLWISPLLMTSTEFQLPEIGELVFVLHLDDLLLWTELPDSNAWSDLNKDDDYPDLYLFKHRNVYEFRFTQSEGFKILEAHQKKVKTKNVELYINENVMQYFIGDWGIHMKNDSISLGTLKSSKKGHFIVNKDGTIVFNENEHSDFVAMAKATQKRLNKIEQDINKLKNVFKNWVPVPMDGAAALKGAATSWFTANLIETVENDIKAEKLKL